MLDALGIWIAGVCVFYAGKVCDRHIYHANSWHGIVMRIEERKREGEMEGDDAINWIEVEN